MEDSCRWLLLRDISVFRPDHYKVVICERDTSLEVIEGHRERRNTYVVDMFTGRSWGRIGSGQYLKWSSIPPAGMLLSSSEHRPMPDKHIVICSKVPQYFGPRIGRVHADSNQLLWQIFSDTSNSWIGIPASYIEGWLNLP